MRKLLLVDDDELVRLALETILTDAGYQVTSARDGLEALECAAHQRFDLVLTDFRMPRMNGAELVTALRATQPDLPVVVMTAYMPAGDQNGPARLRSEGIPVLEKPFPPTDAVSVVRSCLGRRTTEALKAPVPSESW